MKTLKVAVLFFIILLFKPSVSLSDTLSFPQVWQSVREKSPAIQSSQFATEAAEEGQSRAQRHWLPRLYLDARTYQTDDPGASFFGVLEQRKVESSDFVTQTLNHPGTQTFSRGALGLDLALFEGGMKDAQVSMSRSALGVQKYRGSQIEIEQYAQTGLAYSFLISIQKQKTKLMNLKSDLEKLMKSYQLGQKSNPVGYSGFLGMKSLGNRISGLISSFEAQEKASYQALAEMGVANAGWNPVGQDVRSFIQDYFGGHNAQNNEDSFRTLAQAEGAKALEGACQMERARYLPRVGAFAESYLFQGQRDTAQGSTVGLYLQWNLFDPSSYGTYGEAKLKALAEVRMSEAARQRERAERGGLLEKEQALRENLERLEESDRLLGEQTQVSSTLFRNGSISALQFTEILNRRTDLIAQQTEVESSLLQTAASRISMTQFQVPQAKNNGEPK